MAQGGGVRRGLGGLAAAQRRAGRTSEGTPEAPSIKYRKTTPCTVDESNNFNGLRGTKSGPPRGVCSVGQNRGYTDIVIKFGYPKLRARRSREPEPALHPRPHPCKRTAHRCRPRVPASRLAAGPVAQWLEPAAHNGLVAGSSPAGPTKEISDLGRAVAPHRDDRTRYRTRYVRLSFAHWVPFGDLRDCVRQVVRMMVTIGVEQHLK
ncbi:hypothetical protein ABH973_003924 [Bradyrhizobium ottawaense]